MFPLGEPGFTFCCRLQYIFSDKRFHKSNYKGKIKERFPKRAYQGKNDFCSQSDGVGRNSGKDALQTFALPLMVGPCLFLDDRTFSNNQTYNTQKRARHAVLYLTGDVAVTSHLALGAPQQGLMPWHKKQTEDRNDSQLRFHEAEYNSRDKHNSD